MSRLFLTFYGDDFTGSTDALEQLTLAGIRTVLFLEPPAPRQIARFKNLQAVGVAGTTRSLAPAAMEKELRPALKKLKALGAPHVHYKVCSTFDSSPRIGSIGRVIDIGRKMFRAPFVPLVVAAPALGRYCLFGNLFARMGIGSGGEIYRLDRHPSVSRHPVTPMQEADLRLHLARQTREKIGLFDILMHSRSPMDARLALERILRAGSRVVLFDALYASQLKLIGELMDENASRERPLFSVGSSGVEMALGAHWIARRGGARLLNWSKRLREMGTPLVGLIAGTAPAPRPSAGPLLVASGSCSLVTEGQIAWALEHGFAEVRVEAAALVAGGKSGQVVGRTAAAAIKSLAAGRSVVVHTGRRTALNHHRAHRIGAAQGQVVRRIAEQSELRRFCIAGGDTSSFAARALGIEALEMIAPLTPGAPLCRAFAPGSAIDGSEVVFKGGQVGAADYFGTVARGGVK